MKKLIFVLLVLLTAICSQGQSKQYIRADSTYIMRDNGNGELVLLNGTRDSTGGLLTNIGKGRTKFIKTPADFVYVIPSSGSTITVDGNTISLPQFIGYKIRFLYGNLPMQEASVAPANAYKYTWNPTTGILTAVNFTFSIDDLIQISAY